MHSTRFASLPAQSCPIRAVHAWFSACTRYLSVTFLSSTGFPTSLSPVSSAVPPYVYLSNGMLCTLAAEGRSTQREAQRTQRAERPQDTVRLARVAARWTELLGREAYEAVGHPLRSPLACPIPPLPL